MGLGAPAGQSSVSLNINGYGFGAHDLFLSDHTKADGQPYISVI